MTPSFDEKQYLQDLQALIAYDTSRIPAAGDAPFGKPTLDALNTFLKLAAGYGFKTKNVDNYCGYVEYGSGKQMVALLSHLDVVPAGDPATWNTPPFKLTVKDDVMYGRGTVDDKGPLVLALHVLKALKDSGVQPILVFTGDTYALALAVDRIVDVVETRLSLELAPNRPGILGVAAVSGQATDVLDVNHFMLQALAEHIRGDDGHDEAAKAAA